MPSLRDENAIETLLMTSQINTDFVNYLVPLTTEPSTSVDRVGTDTCESKINSILRYKDRYNYVILRYKFVSLFIPIKLLTKIFECDSLIILSVTGVRFVIDYGLDMI
ncbi:uncharacterized protein TNCV_2380931 [Trichonephila clavipes]|nr:uncharacterized protein TNCV_2380931 [Trichonephila clavipes]